MTGSALAWLTGETYTGAKFVGITNGGEFCYTVTFPVEGGTDSKKLFLKYDSAANRLSVN